MLQYCNQSVKNSFIAQIVFQYFSDRVRKICSQTEPRTRDPCKVSSQTNKACMHGPMLGAKCHMVRKNVQPDRGLNPGPLAYRAVPTELSGCLTQYLPDGDQVWTQWHKSQRIRRKVKLKINIQIFITFIIKACFNW